MNESPFHFIYEPLKYVIGRNISINRIIGYNCFGISFAFSGIYID